MELWTPNRKLVDPRPICPKCGGWTLPERPYAERYFTFHRACCCAACGPAPTITLSNVAHCTNCFGRDKWTLLSVNGSYDTVFSGETDTDCSYELEVCPGSVIARVDRYETGSDCTGDVQETFEYNFIGVGAALYKIDSSVKLVGCIVEKRDICTPTVNGTGTPSVFFWQGSQGEKFIGDTLPNQRTCTAGDGTSDSGTATLST